MARRAVAVNERTCGLDSHDTLIALLNLAYLEVESGSIVNSLKVYGLLTQIWATIFDSKHVSIATIIANSTLYLQSAGLIHESRKILEKLIDLSVGIHGEESYATGFLKFRHAFVLAQEERFDDALKEAATAHKILRNTASEKHYLTKQSRNLVSQLTRYKLIQTENQRHEKQKLKALAKDNQAKAKINGKGTTKAAGTKNFENIDDILKFLGEPNSNGTKSKKKSNKKN